MQKTLQEWVDAFGQIDMPVFDQTWHALAKLEKSPDVTGAKIASLTLPDPMMVLKVMRMANSRRRNGIAQPILTIEHAVMMVGMSASFGKMLACPTLEAVPDSRIMTGLMAPVARACHAAAQTSDWAVLRLDLNVEEVYIAALMQEIGEMALWYLAPDQMQSLLPLRRKHGAATAEQEVFGFTMDALTLALANALNLPPLIAASLRSEDCALHPRARLVSIARHLARHAESGWYDEPVSQDISDLAGILRISPDDVTARVHRTAVTVARNRAFPGVTPAAAWLPMLPGSWPEEEAIEPSATPVETAFIDPFGAVMAEIASHMNGTLNLNELMKLVLKGMREGIGLKRVVLALLNQERSQLRSRFVVGAQEDSPLKQFQFDMRQPTLFSKMMGKQQAFWLNDEIRPKVQALLDNEIKRVTAVSEFFVMTVAVHGKVIGMFYADREGQAMDAHAYDKFKQLCTQASAGMAHLAKS